MEIPHFQNTAVWRFRRVQRIWPAVLAACVTLALTFSYWQSEQQKARAIRQQVFSAAADQISNNLRQRLSSYELVLRGVKGFHESAGAIEPDDYHRYWNSLGLTQKHLGLRAVGVALHIPKNRQTSHVAGMRLRGATDYSIRPEGERLYYAPITLTEPFLTTDRSPLGFDLASNPALKQALELARDTGSLTSSERTAPDQDAGLGDSHAPDTLMLFLPLYGKSLSVDTLAERRQALLGWVYGTLDMTDLAAGLSSPADADISVDIHVGDPASGALPYGTGAPLAWDTGLQVSHALDLDGKHWTVVMHTLPEFEKRFAADRHWTIVAMGFALSLLLGWLVWRLIAERDRARANTQRMMQELRNVTAELESTLDALPDVLFELGLNGRYYKCHTSRLDLLATPPDLMLGKLMADVLPAQAGTICLEALQEAHQTGLSLGRQIEIPIAGEQRWYELSVARKVGSPVHDPRFIMISRDITERKQLEAKLQLATSVFTHAKEGILITDARGSVVEVNDTFTQITGYSRAEALGQNPRMLQSGRQDPEFYATLWQDLANKGFWYGEIWNRRKSGEIYAEMLTISAVRDALGKTQNYVALFTDITSIKEHEHQLEHIAHYDTLTDLPNRVLLAERLKRGLVQSQRRGKSLAIAYVDLDGLKTVNDTHGHGHGDELLITVAKRMKTSLRETDTLARIGGDEFVAVLVDLEQANDFEVVVQRLLQAAAEPVLLANTALQVSASIGLTLYPQDNADTDLLLRHANQAMYVAKQSGKNRYHLFDTNQNATIQIRQESLEHIRRALRDKEFMLYYQPKVNLLSGQMTGAEALLRWQHPERGLLSPFNFLHVIEDHPICEELGEWVINTVLTHIAEWRASGVYFPVSVNVSATQLQHADFARRLHDLLLAHPEVPPSALELEVQETSALEDISRVSNVMRALQARGIRFTLDDFGTGYSSLNYLWRLPVEALKIDQSFVRGMSDDPNDLAIVKGIIGLAKAFDREVIAEGMETAAHGCLLLSLGCGQAQGYGIARPMPSEALPGWIADWHASAAWMVWRNGIVPKA